MTVTDIQKSLLKHKRPLILFVAIVVLLCHCYLGFAQTHTATVYIKYVDENAKNGQAANGSVLKPYEIADSYVVGEALKQLGINDIKASSLAQKITVTPVLSKAEQEKYGDCTSANCILFCNDLADVLNATLQEQGIDRVMTVYFFSYLSTISAPAKQNADGTYSPIDETIKCNENVGVIYCPIQANFYYDIDADINSFYEEQMYKWNALCDKVAVWLYQARFRNYFYPYCLFYFYLLV